MESAMSDEQLGSRPTPSPEDILADMVVGFEVTQAVHVFARLGIADLLVDGPRSTEDLAAAVGADAHALYRLLRALASRGMLREDAELRFSITEVGALLRDDHPASFRREAILLGHPLVWRPWGELYSAVMTGTPAFDRVFGEPFFAYIGRRPDEAAVFNAAMTSGSAEILPAILAAYDFSGVRTIVDVGGGEGALLGGILDRYPGIRGTVFDLPEVARSAERAHGATGGAGRLAFVGGDMFQGVPAGGDLYLLMRVLHDWSDDEAERILRACHRSMAPGGTLLVVERLLTGAAAGGGAPWVDLNMLVLVSGRERTEQDFRSLFAAAGFAVTRILPAGGLNLIEGKRA